MRARIVKNKVAPPFKTAELDIMFNEGISKQGELLEIGVEKGFVTKRGSFYSLGDIRLGQGRENAKQFLKENPDIGDQIEGLITGRTPDSGEESAVNGNGSASDLVVLVGKDD